MLRTERIPNLFLIVATADNNVIGVNNTLPWNLPEDLQHFRKQTSGHTIIMGRKTFESIGKALPNRKNIVITRQKDYSAPGCAVVDSLQRAVSESKHDDKVFIIGGAEIYRQAMDLASHIVLTKIDLSVAGDAAFPDIDEEWKMISAESFKSATGLSYTIKHLKHMDV